MVSMAKGTQAEEGKQQTREKQYPRKEEKIETRMLQNKDKPGKRVGTYSVSQNCQYTRMDTG